MSTLVIISIPILFFIIGGLFILGHHALTHDGNFFDVKDMKLAFASHESILFLLIVFTFGYIGGVLL